MRKLWTAFWSNAPGAWGWGKMPAFMRVLFRVVILGALAFLLYHAFTVGL
jgi:hypothetical protein